MADSGVYLQKESKFEGKYKRSIFETLWACYSPFKYSIGSFFILCFVGRILLLLNSNVMGWWADALLREGVASTFTTHYLYIALFITAGGFALTLGSRILFARKSSQAVSLFYDEVTYKTSRYPMIFFDRNPVGRIVTRFSSDYGNVFRMFGGPLAEFFTICFDVISSFLLVAVSGFRFLLVYFVYFVINFLIYKIKLPRLRKERRETSAKRSPAISHFAESVQGLIPIRVYGRENNFFSRFHQFNQSYLVQRLKNIAVTLRFNFAISVSTAFFLLMMGLLGLHWVEQKVVTVGQLSSAMALMLLGSGAIQVLFDWFAQLEEALAGIERLDEYLQKPLEDGTSLPAESRFIKASARAGEAVKIPKSSFLDVHFEHLNFRYDKDLPLVLKDIHFSVPAGKKLGIVGRTGGGKSSLIQALFYLYAPESGYVSVGNQLPDLNSLKNYFLDKINLEQFRSRIALISQDPILFRGTLQENLYGLGKKVPAQEELLSVLDRVGLADWYRSVAQNPRYFIEERAKNLSAGEKQLLCMVRCMLQPAPVVVFDEATSYVDPQSEKMLMKATQEFFKDKTQLIVAHRLSTVEHCDSILWLRDGQIEMVDTPDIVLPKFQNFLGTSA